MNSASVGTRPACGNQRLWRWQACVQTGEAPGIRTGRAVWVAGSRLTYNMFLYVFVGFFTSLASSNELQIAQWWLTFSWQRFRLHFPPMHSQSFQTHTGRWTESEVYSARYSPRTYNSALVACSKGYGAKRFAMMVIQPSAKLSVFTWGPLFCRFAFWFGFGYLRVMFVIFVVLASASSLHLRFQANKARHSIF